MAEAAVETIPAKYFCHECSTSIDISPNIGDLACPKCNGGFIEEMTRELEENNTQTTNTLIPQDYIASLFSALSMTPSQQRNSSYWDSSDEENNYSESVVRPSNLFRRYRPDTPTLEQPLPRFLETLFSSISGNEPNWLPNILNLNLDDYAWGENGLDNIITQFLNQIDVSSPPPASDADIENLENIVADDKLLEKASQCSICMELFILEDKIKKLPCIHYFHTDCILPWLKLHGTCPICRQIISSSKPAEDDRLLQERNINDRINHDQYAICNLMEDEEIDGNCMDVGVNLQSDNSSEELQWYNTEGKSNIDKNDTEMEAVRDDDDMFY